MRILQVHNRYRPNWGGEDTVVNLEGDLLRRNGHEVDRLSVWTGELEGANPLKLVAAGFGTVWSFRGYSLMKKAIAAFDPDILHVHNTFPLLSPSVYWAAEKAGVPVVQTLHNYRLTCANSVLMRHGKPCEDCVGRFPSAALRHRCYGPSLVRTAAVVSKNVAHKWIGTFRKKIHAYIVLTEFSKEIFVRAGLPRDRIAVKPNFNIDPGERVSLRVPRVIFAGAIDRFKGAHLLLEAWTRLPSTTGYQLSIVGDGPDKAKLQGQFAKERNIVWHGAIPRSEVIELIGSSRLLVLPSLGYENFPMAVLEAFSVGTPVVVPGHGSFTAVVRDGHEGLLFSPGSVESLTKAIHRSLNALESEWIGWSRNARNRFLSEYTDSINYEQLMTIYKKARECSRTTRPQRQEQYSVRPLTATAKRGDSE